MKTREGSRKYKARLESANSGAEIWCPLQRWQLWARSRTWRSFTVGLGHSHTLTCQAAKATSIAGAKRGHRRREEGRPWLRRVPAMSSSQQRDNADYGCGKLSTLEGISLNSSVTCLTISVLDGVPKAYSVYNQLHCKHVIMLRSFINLRGN